MKGLGGWRGNSRSERTETAWRGLLQFFTAKWKGVSLIRTLVYPLPGSWKIPLVIIFRDYLKMHEMGFSPKCSFLAQEIFTGFNAQEWERAPEERQP